MSSPGPAPYGWTMAPRAQRDVAVIPRPAADACLVHISERLVHNPRRLGGELHEPYAGHHGCHVGDYRVVYRIDDQKMLVRVARIEYRGKVFRTGP